MTEETPRRLRLGLALGAGAARGWAHVGVLRVLQQAGIEPDVVCGTSIGAMVGAFYVTGQLNELEQWGRGLGWREMVALADVRLGGGLFQGRKLVELLRQRLSDPGIEQLPKPFACVCTELNTGREVWLRNGSLVDAVRATIAVPGVLAPVRHEGRVLVDGALLNPVPVSVCRALGADVVLAVDLNAYLYSGRKGKRGLPSAMDALTTGLNIVQWRITQSRFANDPADVVLRPDLSALSAMDFHRHAPALAAGRLAAEQALPALLQALHPA